MKLLLFGASKGGQRACTVLSANHEIIGFCDNDQAKHSQLFCGRSVYSPEQLLNIQYDQILICSMFADDIFRQLTQGLNIPASKVKRFDPSNLPQCQAPHDKSTPMDYKWNYLGALNEILTTWLPGDAKAFCEWGAGYSTFVLAAALKACKGQRFLSIDHSPEYLSALTHHFAPNRYFTPAAVELYDAASLKQSTKLFYTQAPVAGRCQYDFMLVDGRARAECLLTAALLVSRNGVVVLDDSARIRYSAGLVLFDVIDSKLRFKVLRLKESLRSFFSEFLNTLCHEESQDVIAEASSSPKGGMGHVPDLPEWSGDELMNLKQLLETCCPRAKTLFAWSAAMIPQYIFENTNLALDQAYVVADKHESSATVSDGIIIQKASLTGNLNDLSKDPNLHYSTALFSRSTLPDVFIVAGHRPNECLLSTAFMMKEDAIVIVRNGTHPNLRAGCFLFETVAEQGGLVALRRKPGLCAVFESLRAEVLSATQDAKLIPLA